MGFQKPQFLNSLANWEKFGSEIQAYIQKSQFFIFFMNWKKLRSPPRARFKNPKISLLIEKKLKVQPKTNTQKIPILNPWMN